MNMGNEKNNKSKTAIGAAKEFTQAYAMKYSIRVQR